MAIGSFWLRNNSNIIEYEHFAQTISVFKIV